ncbi:MAG: trigger factor [Patescibacteria group bacterium]
MSESTNKPQPNTVVFTVTIPWPEVKDEYQIQLKALASQAELPGFRKGMAPINLVEEKADKKKLFGQVIEVVLPKAYKKEAESRKLIPFIQPRVKPIQAQENQDWQFEITVITKPEVNLADLEEKLKAVMAPLKIITPDKKEATKDEKLKIAFDTLLDTVKVDLPLVLVEEEVNLRLSQLVDQVQSIGMTMDQYLSAKQLTPEKLRESYQKTAKEMLILNLALDKIAEKNQYTGKDRTSLAVDWLVSH